MTGARADDPYTTPAEHCQEGRSEPPAQHTDELSRLLNTLPERLRAAAAELPAYELEELVLDIGRAPQARCGDRLNELSPESVQREDLDAVVAAVGSFNTDNRAGLEGTLHRVSAIRNRAGAVVGLTLRVGRTVTGTAAPLTDLVARGESLLLLGRPGVGKTTRLREIARMLADDLGRRTIVIDTANEIAGDGDVPHPAIGAARRMQVAQTDRQHAVMIEAVENHMPQAIVIDEIGTAAEAAAARTIAERGVQLIATAHGNTLDNVVANPTLSELVGGVQTVTLGDDEARLRGSRKTINERKTRPTFSAVVEIADRDTVTVHDDTARAVDRLLRGRDPGGNRRGSSPETPQARPAAPPAAARTADADGPVRIYAHALSRDSVDRVIRSLGLDARTVRQPERADLVIALRGRADDARLQPVSEERYTPVYPVKKNSTSQIRRLLEKVFYVVKGVPDREVRAAVREAEEAAREVIEVGEPVALSPCSGELRKVQHRIAVQHRLNAESVGSEPGRHLVIHPA